LPGVSARFRVLELREPHLQNLPRCYPAVAVFFDEDELLPIGQTGRNHHLSTSFQLVDQGRGMRSGAAVTITLSNGAVFASWRRAGRRSRSFDGPDQDKYFPDPAKSPVLAFVPSTGITFDGPLLEIDPTCVAK
jgi:hypothetical protein